MPSGILIDCPAPGPCHPPLLSSTSSCYEGSNSSGSRSSTSPCIGSHMGNSVLCSPLLSKRGYPKYSPISPQPRNGLGVSCGVEALTMGRGDPLDMLEDLGGFSDLKNLHNGTGVTSGVPGTRSYMTARGLPVGQHGDLGGLQGDLGALAGLQGGLQGGMRGGNMTECVPVSSSEHVAEIVGRQGAKIKALRSSTNTYIKTPVRGEEPVFVVTGRKEDVAAAKKEILSAAEHFSQIRASRMNGGASSPGGSRPSTAMGFGDGGQLLGQNLVTIKVRVPYKVVGLVVGPKGATIKRIQQDTHTYIVTPSRDKEPVFVVTGEEENVEKARSEIEGYIALRTRSATLSDSGCSGGVAGGERAGLTHGSSVDEILCGDERAGRGEERAGRGKMMEMHRNSLGGFSDANNNTEHNKLINMFLYPEAFPLAGNSRGKPSLDSNLVIPSMYTADQCNPVLGGLNPELEALEKSLQFHNLDNKANCWQGNTSWGFPNGNRNNQNLNKIPQQGLPPSFFQDHIWGSSLGSTDSSTSLCSNISSLRLDDHLPAFNQQHLNNTTTLQNNLPPPNLSTLLHSGFHPSGFKHLEEAPQNPRFTSSYNLFMSRAGSSGSLTHSPSTSPADCKSAPEMPRIEARRCYLCADADVVAAMVPCGHNSFCMDCANAVLNQPAEANRRCPICLQPAVLSIRIRP